MHDLIKPTRIDTFWSVGLPLITYTIIGLVGGLFIGGFAHLFFVFRSVAVPGGLFFGVGCVVLCIGIAVGVSEGRQEYQAIQRDTAHYHLLESYLGSNPEVIRSSNAGPSFVFVQQSADRSRQLRCTTTDLQDPQIAYHVHLCAMNPELGLITENYAVLRPEE